MVQIVPNGREECCPERYVGGRSVCEATTGFESDKYPHRVYKLRKALYGLTQVPEAWYGRLRRILFERGFEMGKVDQTLFLTR
jgi:hypothetical protein